MNSQTEDLEFVGIYLQSLSVCLLFQIQLGRIHDWVWEQVDVISIVAVI